MNAVKFNCPYYEVCGRKKDLHLSEDICLFDKNKIRLVTDYFNENNFKIEYNNNSFRLFVSDLYCTVKKETESENLYFSINNDHTSNGERLREIFSELKELLLNKNINKEISVYKWNKVWLTASDYDCQIGHSYHVKDLYLAIDSIICLDDPFLKTYKLDCFMIDSSIFLCSKCDTFPL